MAKNIATMCGIRTAAGTSPLNRVTAGRGGNDAPRRRRSKPHLVLELAGRRLVRQRRLEPLAIARASAAPCHGVGGGEAPPRDLARTSGSGDRDPHRLVAVAAVRAGQLAARSSSPPTATSPRTG